jgi:hypothetical protein
MAQANVSEAAKIPLYYGQKEKDTIRHETWLDRCEQAAVVQGWNDAQKIMAASNALRGSAEKWYRIEIRPLRNPTWAIFRERFLGFSAHKVLPYRGGKIWPKIFNAHKEPNVTDHYLTLALNMIEFNEILPTYVHQDHNMLESTLAMPGIAALSPAEKQAFARDTINCGRNIDMNATAMSVFFSNLPTDVKDFLLARPEYSDLVLMKNAVEAFIQGRSATSSVNVIDDVDAIRNKRASTKNARPDQPRRNITCYYCNKKGHGQQECRKRERDGADMVKPPPRPQNAATGQHSQQRNKVNETSEVQSVQSAFQSHMNHLN